jgi:hypothetical protein
MSFFAGLLRGHQIADVYSDSEVTYLMLSNGTQVTVRGEIVVQPAIPQAAELPAPASAPRLA